MCALDGLGSWQHASLLCQNPVLAQCLGVFALPWGCVLQDLFYVVPGMVGTAYQVSLVLGCQESLHSVGKVVRVSFHLSKNHKQTNKTNPTNKQNPTNRKKKPKKQPTNHRPNPSKTKHPPIVIWTSIFNCAFKKLHLKFSRSSEAFLNLLLLLPLSISPSYSLIFFT